MPLSGHDTSCPYEERFLNSFQKMMKILRLMTVFFAALTLTLCEATPTKAPRTVLDYLDLLPKRFFEIEYDVVSRRKWLHQGFGFPAYNRSIIDIKHDYLRFPGDGAQGRLDIAVFRYRGQDTVGVYNAFEEGDLTFWRLLQGRLVEVTKQVLPSRWNRGKYNYVMPRLGTSIQVVEQTFSSLNRAPRKTPLYLLKWQSGRFLIGANPRP